MTDISYTHYLIIEDGKVTDSHLSDFISYDNQTITLKKGQPIQLHVIIKMNHTVFDLNYVIEDQCIADIIETRELNDAKLNRTLNIGADTHVNIFNENDSVNDKENIVTDQGSVDREAVVQVGYCELSDGDMNAHYHYNLNGSGADVRVRMAVLSKDNEKKYYEVLIKHNKPHTTGIMDNYGVVKDNGYLTLDGVGTITKGQHGSASHQTNKIMVFDEGCHASANPFLYIDDYDVQASHAAGVGKMDEDHLYYLQSRGLTKRRAMQLITYGYLQPVIEVVDNEMLKVRFENALQKVGA